MEKEGMSESKGIFPSNHRVTDMWDVCVQCASNVQTPFFAAISVAAACLQVPLYRRSSTPERRSVKKSHGRCRVGWQCPPSTPSCRGTITGSHSLVTQSVRPSQASTPALAMDHALNVLWMEKNVALAVDQVFGEVSPCHRFCPRG